MDKQTLIVDNKVKIAWLRFILLLCSTIVAAGFCLSISLAIGEPETWSSPRLVLFIGGILKLLIIIVTLVLMRRLLKMPFKKLDYTYHIRVINHRLAGRFNRIRARIIDEVIIITIFFVTQIVIDSLAMASMQNLTITGSFIVLSYIIVSFSYYTMFWKSGRTIGMELSEIAILTKDETIISFNQAAKRSIFDILIKLTFGLILLFLKKNAKPITKLDKVSSTYCYSCIVL